MQERSCKGKEQAKTLEDLEIYSYLRFVDYFYHHSHFRDNLGNNFSSIPLFILSGKNGWWQVGEVQESEESQYIYSLA